MKFFIQVARQYWGLLVTALALGVISAWIVTTFVAPPTYSASAQIFVGTTSESRDSAGLNQSGQFAQQRVKTYARLIASPRVLDPVIDELGLDISSADFAAQVTATAPLDTVLITVEVNDEDPRIAEEAANAIANQFSLIAPQLETSDSGQPAPVTVSVATPATLPLYPTGQSRITYYILGSLAGLTLAAGIVLLVETWRPRYRQDSELADRASLRVLGHIRKPDLSVASKRRHSEQADPFKLVRNKLNASDTDHGLTRLLVVPANPHRYSAPVSLNLAKSYAAAGWTVALIDGDLAGRALTRLLTDSPGPGLPEVLRGDVTPTNALMQTADQGVSLLTSGANQGASFELSLSADLMAVIEEIGKSCDLVIIDGPAPLGNADALVWANLAAATILLTDEWELRDVVDRAMALLTAAKTQIAGVILVPRRIFRIAAK